MGEFRISSLADCDLTEIYRYIARHSESAAERIVGRLYERFELLATQPLMGERRDDMRPGLRCISMGNYVIFCRPAQGFVEIVRVLHGAQSLPDF